MRDTRACRGCLNTGNKLLRVSETWYRMFETLTGLQASKNDGYPNYFCVECKSHIHKAISFRKKSRRAFFVLKEIMTVRKEVNLPDILTVDRSRVSLESSLGIFNPKRSAIYSLCTSEEGDSELIKEDLNMVNTNAVIDIKGEVAEFPEEVPDAVAPLDDDNNADLGPNEPIDDIEGNAQDLEQKEPEPEIDMNDVFKGLREPDSENSDEEVNVVKKNRKKKTDDDDDAVSDYSSSVKARALLNYDIKELTEDEQKEVFWKKVSHPYFTKALYTCGICVKVMPSVSALMEHFDIHKNRIAGKFLCKICKDKFMTAEEQELHTKEQHMYQYTCKICKDVAYSIREMVKHKKEKHVAKYNNKEHVSGTISTVKSIDYEAELYDKFLLIPLSEEDKVLWFKQCVGSGKCVCDVCGLGLATSTQRRYHRKMHMRKPKNPKLTIRTCHICGVWCPRRKTLAKHMEEYHDYNYHCKLCSYEASNRFLAVDHLTRAHSEINACHICGATSRTESGLQFHMKWKHGSLLYQHHCVFCGSRFKSQYSLYAHQFKEHAFFKLSEPPTESADNACTHCNVQFLSTKAYHNHLVKMEHEEAKDLPWKCLPCRKLFDSEEELRSHTAENSKHKKLSITSFPAPCEVCGEMIDSYQRYYYHYLKRHPGVNLFNDLKKLCDMCGKTYLPRKLHSHVCFDKSSAKYKCSACDVVFQRPNSVVFHVLKKHMKKPFSCTICGLTFRRRYDCKDHILKVHAPVRPYICPICNREFSHIDFLQKHAKDLHDVQVKLDVKLPNKKKLFYLYPNMKVDLSLIDKNIVNEVKIKVADYTDQIFEALHDYSDYVITSDDIRLKVEEGQECKEFLIRNEDRGETESSSSKKTSSSGKNTKKQAIRQFIIGDERQDEESARTHQQFKLSEFIITNDDEDEESATTHQQFKQSKEFIITNDDVDEESAASRQQFNQDYIISEEVVINQDGQSPRKKPKQVHREFIIRSKDVKRRREQSSASPRKKIKYDNFQL